MNEPELLLDVAAQIDPSGVALIIIDMQNDFCVGGFGAAAAGRDIGPARSIIPAIGALLHGARDIGIPVAHVAFWTLPEHGSDSGPWLAQRRRPTYSSDKLCLSDTPGAAFVPELAPAAGEWEIRKHRYSAFAGTDLDLLLRSRRVQTVIICGVSTNACVESTLRAAFDLGYYVVVPSDGCASWDRGLHDATLANVRHRFGFTPTTTEIVDLWRRNGDGGAV